MKKQNLAILGSTGSIGTQTLDVVAANPDLFAVYAITANNNVDLLIKQARTFHPEAVVVANEAHYNTLREALTDLPIKVFAGSDAVAQVAALPSVDTVVTAMVGYAGLKPTIEAVKAGKRIALANNTTPPFCPSIRSMAPFFSVWSAKMPTKSKKSSSPLRADHSAINRAKSWLRLRQKMPFATQLGRWVQKSPSTRHRS